jgi:hypothetical protein
MHSKTIFAAATLVAIAASSPALAKSNHHHTPRNEVYPADAYAAADVRKQRPNHRTNTNDVYDVRGQYVGSDPDPTVRDQLARDPSQGD